MKSIYTYLIVITTLLSAGNTFAQAKESKKEPKNGKFKLIAGFDARNSFVKGQRARFSGLKIGFGNERHHFGLAFHGTRSPIVVDRRNNNGENIRTTFDYNYNSVFYEYIFYKSKRWQFSAPFHINTGELNGFNYKIDGNILDTTLFRERANSLTLSIKGHFKVIRWLGLGAGVGYNYVTKAEPEIKQGLNAPFYSFGVKVFLGELWKLRKKSYRQSEWVE